MDSVQDFKFPIFSASQFSFKQADTAKEENSDLVSLNQNRDQFRKTLSEFCNIETTVSAGMHYAKNLSILLKSPKIRETLDEELKGSTGVKWSSIFSPGIRAGLAGQIEKPLAQITSLVQEYVFVMMVKIFTR